MWLFVNVQKKLNQSSMCLAKRKDCGVRIAVDVVSKRCGCVKATQPVFNVPGQTKGVWCKDCPDKALNAIDVVSKRCGCAKAARPSFNLPQEKKGRWCKDCPDKALDAIDVIHKRCGCVKAYRDGCVADRVRPYRQKKLKERFIITT